MASEAKSDPFVTFEMMKAATMENACPACRAKPGEWCFIGEGIWNSGVCHLGRLHDGAPSRVAEPTPKADRCRPAVRKALEKLAKRLAADVEPAEGDDFERGYHAAGQVVLDAIAALGPPKKGEVEEEEGSGTLRSTFPKGQPTSTPESEPKRMTCSNCGASYLSSECHFPCNGR